MFSLIAPKFDSNLERIVLQQRLFAEGMFIDMNTGVIGKIVKRGVNYVIYIDEHDSVYRGWLKDLIERNDIKRFDFTPQGEIGTPALAASVAKMTPGQFLKKINKKDKDA